MIRTFALTALLLFALTLSVWTTDMLGGTLWFGVYYVVPGAKAIRVPARVYVILYPLLSVAGLLACQRLLEGSRLSATWRAVVIGTLLAIAAAENYFPQRNDPGRSFEAAAFYNRAHRLAGELNGADAAYGRSELPCHDYEHELMMMWAGLYANVPVVNGYSGRAPDRYALTPSQFSLDALQEWLGPNWHGTFVLVVNGETIEGQRWLVDADGEWKRQE